MRIRISTHKPDSRLWLIAAALFIYGLLPLPYSFLALVISALLLLLGTTLI